MNTACGMGVLRGGGGVLPGIRTLLAAARVAAPFFCAASAAASASLVVALFRWLGVGLLFRRIELGDTPSIELPARSVVVTD